MDSLHPKAIRRLRVGSQGQNLTARDWQKRGNSRVFYCCQSRYSSKGCGWALLRMRDSVNCPAKTLFLRPRFTPVRYRLRLSVPRMISLIARYSGNLTASLSLNVDKGLPDHFANMSS